MAGDYIFPREQFTEGAPLSGQDLSLALQPIADRLNAGLNQHNIRAPLPPSVEIEEQAFAVPHLVVSKVDPGVQMTAGGYSEGPARSVSGGFEVNQSTVWQVVGDATKASVSFASGKTSVAVTAWASYCFQTTDQAFFGRNSIYADGIRPYGGLNVTQTGYHSAQVQFAIRVDGAIIETTLTGRKDNELRPTIPITLDQARNLGTSVSLTTPPTNACGPQSLYARNKPDAVNRPMFGVRLGCTVVLSPGDHTIELVVRRAPCGPGYRLEMAGTKVSGGTATSVKNSSVTVYSRGLLAVRTPMEPNQAAKFSDYVVSPSIEEEETLSVASLETKHLEPLRDAANALLPHQVQRGALTSEHVAQQSLVLAAGQEFFGGLSSDVVFAVNSGVEAYRWPFENGVDLQPSGRKLYDTENLTLPVPYKWRRFASTSTASTILSGTAVRPTRCVLEVQANVALAQVYPSIYDNLSWQAYSEAHNAAIVALAIGLHIDGAWKICPESIVLVSGNSYVAYQWSTGTWPVPSTPVNTDQYGYAGIGDTLDVPLTAVYELTSPGLTATISGFALFASATIADLNLSATAAAAAAALANAASLNYIAYEV